MSAWESLGHVGIVYKGAYAPTTLYKKNSVVSINNKLYIALKTVSNINPEDDTANNWTLILSGAAGSDEDTLLSRLAVKDTYDFANQGVGTSILLQTFINLIVDAISKNKNSISNLIYKELIIVDSTGSWSSSTPYKINIQTSKPFDIILGFNYPNSMIDNTILNNYKKIDMVVLGQDSNTISVLCEEKPSSDVSIEVYGILKK